MNTFSGKHFSSSPCGNLSVTIPLIQDEIVKDFKSQTAFTAVRNKDEEGKIKLLKINCPR